MPEPLSPPTLERPLITPNAHAMGQLVMDLVHTTYRYMNGYTTDIRFRNPTTFTFSTLNNQAIKTARLKADDSSWLAHHDIANAAAEVYNRLGATKNVALDAAVNIHAFLNSRRRKFGIFLVSSAVSEERDRSHQILHELAGRSINTAQPQMSPVVLISSPASFGMSLEGAFRRIANQHFAPGTSFSFGPLQKIDPSMTRRFVRPDELETQ